MADKIHVKKPTKKPFHFLLLILLLSILIWYQFLGNSYHKEKNVGSLNLMSSQTEKKQRKKNIDQKTEAKKTVKFKQGDSSFKKYIVKKTKRSKLF